jgi:hypothetical protein
LYFSLQNFKLHNRKKGIFRARKFSCKEKLSQEKKGRKILIEISSNLEIWKIEKFPSTFLENSQKKANNMKNFSADFPIQIKKKKIFFIIFSLLFVFV